MPGKVIALLGAESTGKTTLAQSLASSLVARGADAVVVPEALRLFCDAHGRTPLPHEQAEIARTQHRLMTEAASLHAVVIADTTSVMTAVYSDLLFDDQGLYTPAIRDHAQVVCFTLLTGLDLPWVADGLQRDGPHVREPVDTRLRRVLADAGLPHAVVYGHGPARLAHALQCIEHVLDAPARAARVAGAPRWRWLCDNCDDAECEQHWLGGRR